MQADRESFRQIIERHQRAVYAVAYSGVRDRALADDITQETFLVAWRRLDELRDPERLAAWLCGIARNLARDARKRLRRETLDDADATDATTPYDTMSEAEAERTVAAALGRVPDVYREPLVLYYYEERSVADVARCLGISTATTNKRLSRGRQHLAANVAIVERGVARRGASATLAASVLAIIATTVPASHVDASPVSKGSTMHKLAIAASLVAVVGGGTAAVVVATRTSDAHPSPTTTAAQATSSLAALHGAHAMHSARGAERPSLPALLAGVRHARPTAAAAAAPASSDCAAVGQHLYALEADTGHDSGDRCAADYASICEAEGWSIERRTCALAADSLINAHLCASKLAFVPDDPAHPGPTCTSVGAHLAPIVQAAGLYADVEDFATQVQAACETDSWSSALRACFDAAQSLEELHGCING